MNNEKLKMIIGNNVKKYRILKNLTQEELASLVGCTTPLIGALESPNMSQGISTFTLYKLSKVLGVPADKFFEEKQ